MSVCPFAKYKHIFGVEKQGIHRFRLFDIAIVDVLGTILIAWLISHYSRRPLWIVALCLFVLGIILHRLFCVNTTLNKIIFGNHCC